MRKYRPFDRQYIFPLSNLENVEDESWAFLLQHELDGWIYDTLPTPIAELEQLMYDIQPDPVYPKIIQQMRDEIFKLIDQSPLRVSVDNKQLKSAVIDVRRGMANIQVYLKHVSDHTHP